MPRGQLPPSQAHELIPERLTIPALAEAAADCQACDLYKDTTQTVFGSGPEDASVVMVGEVPGDREDIEGRPFVGPAGRLLDRALVKAGVDRDEVYITNAVKHFRFERRGKLRLHKKPSAEQIHACRPWLDAELATLKPEVLVCLGATAAQALLGSSFRITKQRGQWIPSELAPHVMATAHPSSILRAPDDDAREAGFEALVADLSLLGEIPEARA
jgi:uracil-DNA glycosylase family protein